MFLIWKNVIQLQMNAYLNIFIVYMYLNTYIYNIYIYIEMI